MAVPSQKRARELHRALSSGNAPASGHSAGSGGESNGNFPYNSKCYAISRNETYTAEHIHPRTREETLQAHDHILSDTSNNDDVCILRVFVVDQLMQRIPSFDPTKIVSGYYVPRAFYTMPNFPSGPMNGRGTLPYIIALAAGRSDCHRARLSMRNQEHW